MVKPEKFGHLHLVYHFTIPLNISRSLKLSKVSAWCCSAEHLFGKSLQIIIKVFVAEFVLSKIPCFQHMFPKTFTYFCLFIYPSYLKH